MARIRCLIGLVAATGLARPTNIMHHALVKGLTYSISLAALFCATMTLAQSLPVEELVGTVSINSFAAGAPPVSATELDDDGTEPPHWINNFDQALSESLAQQANVLMEQGFYADAELAFAQALQAERINHGLYTSNQIPLLEALLESLLAQRKWDKLDQRFAYWEQLNRRIVFSNVSKLLDSEQRLSGLYMAAASRGTSQSAWYLIKAKNVNWQAVTVIEQIYGKDDLRLPHWLYKIVLTHYYQSHLNQRRWMTSFEYKSDAPAFIPGWALSSKEYRQQNYDIGLELLERIASIYANADVVRPETEAMMLVHQADWQLLFDQGQAALPIYQNAYQSLLAAGVPQAEVDQFFNQATVLPASELSISWNFADQQVSATTANFVAWSQLYPGVHAPNDYRYRSTSNKQAERATVKFTLEPKLSRLHTFDRELRKFNYEITNLQIVEYFPENESIAQRALDEIRYLQLRPLMSGGTVLSSTDVGLNYVFAQN